MICSVSGQSLVSVFNELFVEKYDNLNRYAKGDGDLLHKNYLKIVDRFTLIAFTAHTMTQLKEKVIAYTKSSIYNTFRTERKNVRETVEIGRDSEDVLQHMDIDVIEEILERQRTEIKTIYLFNYINKHFTQEEAYVFRVYFLYDERNKKITYKQLAAITGFSQSKVCGIVQKIKAALKANLNGYINDLEGKSGRND